MYSYYIKPPEQDEEPISAQVKKPKKKISFGWIVLTIILAILELQFPIRDISMYRMMSKYKLPQGAEIVLKPRVGFFSCCAGDRLGIEEVFRVPVESVKDITFGRTDDELIVEPLGWEYGIEQPGVSGISVHGGYESDCSYVYDYSDLIKIDDYQENDGYCYIHVWGRKYLGREEGLTLWILLLSEFYCFVLSVEFVVGIIIVIAEMLLRALKRHK